MTTRIQATRSVAFVLGGLVLGGMPACEGGGHDRGPHADPPEPRNVATQVGRLTSVGNDEYREWYGYDARGNVTQTWWRFDGRTYVAEATYGYPTRAAEDGEVGPLLVGESLPHAPTAAAEKVIYEYDRGGVQRRVIAERPDASRQTLVHATRTNAIGQVTQIVYGTCSAATCDDSSTNRVVTDRNYDPNTLRLSSVLTTHNEDVLQSFGYAFDPNGNLEEVDDARDDFDAHYDYDSLDRLAETQSGGFTLAAAYDTLGNLVRNDRVIGGAVAQVVQSYGGSDRGPHALATSGAASFEYDRNGNLTVTRGRSADVAITWNAENMPVAVHSGTDASIYRKHFLGDRLWKKVEGDTTTWYLPGVRIASTGDEEELRVYYGNIAELDPEGAFHFHRADHLGSASLVVDARGDVEHRASYWAWGESRPDDEGSFDPIYEYNFKERELATQLLDFGARLYMPDTARFASADPLTVDGPNRYAYVRNNPLRYTDPTGYAAQDKNKLDLPPGAVKPNPGDTIVTDETFIAGEIVADDPCRGCRALDDALGPANDILGAIGDTQSGHNDYIRRWEIAQRTKVSRSGRITLGKANGATLRGIRVGNHIGALGDAAEAINRGTSALDNFSRGNNGEAVWDLVEGGLNIWGGRVGATIGLKCGPAAIICSPALGWLGGKSGTLVREIDKATPHIRKALADQSRTHDLRFGLPK